jgi:hypothetical protein
MDDTKVILEPAEPVYVIPPHPAVSAPLNVETAALETPITAGDSLSDLIEKAMDGLRSELLAELKKDTGGLENNVKS